MTTLQFRRLVLPPYTIKQEYLGLVLAFLLFLAFPYLIRFWDASSAPIDPGVLSAVFVAIAALLSFKAVTWWLMCTIWPALATYSRNSFEEEFLALSPLAKVLIYLCFYLALLFAFVLCLLAIL